MNDKNLRPLKLTHEEAVEYGRRGGKQSVKKKKQRKAFKESLEMLLQMKAPEVAIRQIKNCLRLYAITISLKRKRIACGFITQIGTLAYSQESI